MAEDKAILLKPTELHDPSTSLQDSTSPQDMSSHSAFPAEPPPAYNSSIQPQVEYSPQSNWTNPTFGPDPPRFRKDPTVVNCKHCGCSVQTIVKSEPGPGAFVFGGAICTIGCCCCLCCLGLIPCCLPDMTIYTHSCPECKRFLAKHSGELAMA